jgi:hypothetical protein
MKMPLQDIPLCVLHCSYEMEVIVKYNIRTLRGRIRDKK